MVYAGEIQEEKSRNKRLGVSSVENDTSSELWGKGAVAQWESRPFCNEQGIGKTVTLLLCNCVSVRLPFIELLLCATRSVQFSHSVESDFLRPHGLQHARPPCSSPTPGVYPNSYPLSWWCQPTISSSVVPFSSCPQSFPESGSFPVSQLFTWGGQSIGLSALISVLPMNTQDWSPLGWTGWIFLQSKGLSRVFSNTIIQKCQFFGAQLSL